MYVRVHNVTIDGQSEKKIVPSQMGIHNSTMDFFQILLQPSNLLFFFVAFLNLKNSYLKAIHFISFSLARMCVNQPFNKSTNAKWLFIYIVNPFVCWPF